MTIRDTYKIYVLHNKSFYEYQTKTSVINEWCLQNSINWWTFSSERHGMNILTYISVDNPADALAVKLRFGL